MMLVGEKRKPNTLPLSVDSVNIKFDSLAPTYLLALFINSPRHIPLFELVTPQAQLLFLPVIAELTGNDV